MRIGIGIFAKTIGHSMVKTRLAEAIGQKAAEEFYGLCVKAVEEVVTSYSNTLNVMTDELKIYWARPSGRYDISTRGLSLGVAMYKVASRILVDCDAYIIIGTDIPQMTQATLNQTMDNLKSSPLNLVFGPSIDGGFYLLAGTYAPALKLMENVQYSQADTLEQFLNLLHADSIKHTLIEELSDVDVVEDFIHLRDYLSNKSENSNDLLESQKSILQWLIKRNLSP